MRLSKFMTLFICWLVALAGCSVSSRSASDFAYSACYEFDGNNESNLIKAADMDASYLMLLAAFQRRSTSADFYFMCDEIFKK